MILQEVINNMGPLVSTLLLQFTDVSTPDVCRVIKNLVELRLDNYMCQVIQFSNCLMQGQQIFLAMLLWLIIVAKSGIITDQISRAI
jgi:hypothetical protein